MFSWNMQNPELTKCDLFPDEVNVQLNMFGPAMVYWILREVHSRDVVTVDDRGLVDMDVELAKKIVKPIALSSCIGYCSGTRPRCWIATPSAAAWTTRR
jgi:hypothetical protein